MFQRSNSLLESSSPSVFQRLNSKHDDSKKKRDEHTKIANRIPEKLNYKVNNNIVAQLHNET
jgi:hypothetical protein